MIRLIILSLLITQCTLAVKEDPPAPDFENTKQERLKISQTMASHQKYIRHCYGQALEKQQGGSLQGKLMVFFDVGPDGRASDVRVVPERSAINNPTLNRCLISGIQSWDFPVHPQGERMEVYYPFFFTDRPPAGMQKRMDRFQKLKK
jgi:TonB family protein